MYGLIVENVLGYLRTHYHPHRYEEIKASAKLNFDDPIDLFKVYPEGVIPRIGKKASMHLQIAEKEIFEGVGVYFVTFYKKLGYRQTVARIGRYLREFIINLDNCHDYFKLTFTNMRAPSFFIEHEHAGGLSVIYRSKRRGFTYYVVGQLKEIAKSVFNLVLEIEVKKQEIVFDTVVVTYNLSFDNSAYTRYREVAALRQEASLPVRANVIFEIFPFGILFNDNLVITLVGSSLRLIMPNIVGQSMNSCFSLVRPLIEFSADQIMQRTNNVFVFQALVPSSKIHKERAVELSSATTKIGRKQQQVSNDYQDDDGLQIRGSVLYMEDWKRILFLGCPIINGTPNLVDNGLFLNDLSIHDHSRDMVITATQTLMEEVMTKKYNEKADALVVDMDMRREMLKTENERKFHSWIPPQVEIGLPDERVRKLDFASLLLATIDRFDLFCHRADPVDLVELLDDISAIVDHLTESLGALRVEMEKDFLVMSDYTAGLSPETQAERMATTALDLDHAARIALREPVGKRSKPVRFRIAVVGGPVVYAVVGRQLPKFCVLGPTLLLAERLLEMCPPDRIIAPEELTFKLSSDFKYSAERVKMGLKGKDPSTGSNADLSCIYLEGKQDHQPIPVLHIVQAYGAFKVKAKAHKQKALLMGGLRPEDGNKGTENGGNRRGMTTSAVERSPSSMTNGVGIVGVDSDDDMCSGFFISTEGKSRSCSIL